MSESEHMYDSSIRPEEVILDDPLGSQIDRLKLVVERLRAEDGCPWDRAQTHESLKPEVIEEAAEVVCGINILKETGSADNLKEELGDLLLQVMFHAVMAEEEGLFTLEDVARSSAEKMIRRHPHVFGKDIPPGSLAGLSTKGGAETGKLCCAEETLYGKGNAAFSDRSMQSGETAQEFDYDSFYASWEEIKKLEKSGREWEKDYLPAAMEEAGQLLERAKRRKGFA